MARGDIKLQWPNESKPFNTRRIVGSGVAGSIKAGEPTKSGTAGAVAIMADGDGSTSQKFSGIAKTDSTDTVAAAGECYTYVPFPGLVYAAKAKSLTAATTLALLDALMDKRVVFDVTASVWTIDTAASNATTNGVLVVGGEYQTNTIYFAVSQQVTIFDNPTTA